jgi:ribosomal protein S6--L-glutamate ligase
MKIAVLSSNPNLYSTKRLVEAGITRGHDVNIINHMACNIGIEENNPTLHYKGELLPHYDAVIPRIGASVTFFGTAVVRQFEMVQTFSAVKSVAIVRSRDKLRTMQILSKAGLGIPKTAFASHPREIDHLIDQVGGTPVVIKLLEGTQGIGVVLAETRKAAKSVLEAFYGLNANILVQEFVKESQGADIRAFVVDGKVVGAMKRQGKEGEFRSNLHRGGEGKIIRLSRDEKAAALKAASALGLAIAGVDLLQSARGPLILEVNSSPGLQGIESATGIDIAGHIIKYIEHNVPNKRTRKDKIGI